MDGYGVKPKKKDDDGLPPLWQQPGFGPKPLGDKPSAPAIDHADNEARTYIQRYASTGHPDDADAYLKHIRPWISAAVRAYAGPDAGPAVWAQAKRIALDAAPKYDPARGVKVRTFLMPHFQGLRRASARSDTPVRVPERTAIDAGRVSRYEAELAAELGRDPSDAELADRTGLPLDRIAKARGHAGFLPESATPEGAAYVTPGPTKADREAWMRYVYHDLDPVNQIILEHSVGLNNKPVLRNADLAKKLGVTPGAVSQRRAKIEALLNEYHDAAVGRQEE